METSTSAATLNNGLAPCGVDRSRCSTESTARQLLRGFINKLMCIEITDGRVLTGTFLCTDKDSNIILGGCSEYLPQSLLGEHACKSSAPAEQDDVTKIETAAVACDTERLQQLLRNESRPLGLVMVPGRHIVKLVIDVDPVCDQQSLTLLPDSAGPITAD